MKTSTSSPSRLRLWEAALFLAFGLTLTAGVWAGASEAALAGRVLRLHVIANSDSEADQARKLLVRDAVLSRAAQLLDGAGEHRVLHQQRPGLVRLRTGVGDDVEPLHSAGQGGVGGAWPHRGAGV